MEESSFQATVLLPVALALIMTSLGLSLTLADFRRVLTRPRGVLIGMANLLVVSPALAFGVAELYALGPAFAVGLVLLGASPGGTMANLLTHLARGETALSVSITAISSIAAVLTVPLYLGLAIDYFGVDLVDDVSMGGIVARVFAITVVPLSIGMWIRARNPTAVAAREPLVKKVALLTFLVVVVSVVVAEFETVVDNLGALAVATLTLNVLAMAIAFATSRAARLGDRQATAIAMELGIHNSTLAIAVAATVADVLTVPAAVYSAFMFITAGLFARIMHARNARAPAPATEPAVAGAG